MDDSNKCGNKLNEMDFTVNLFSQLLYQNTSNEKLINNKNG